MVCQFYDPTERVEGTGNAVEMDRDADLVAQVEAPAPEKDTKRSVTKPKIRIAPLSRSIFGSTQQYLCCLAGPSLLPLLSMNNNALVFRSLALHVPTASSTRCSPRSRKPPYTKEK